MQSSTLNEVTHAKRKSSYHHVFSNFNFHKHLELHKRHQMQERTENITT